MSSLLARRTLVSVTDIFRLLRMERFSGSVTIHFANGEPQKVESGRPIQTAIYVPASEPSAQVLEDPVDKRVAVSSR